jgi:serine phosphatase RsbU (regulator of sigma subunit)
MSHHVPLRHQSEPPPDGTGRRPRSDAALNRAKILEVARRLLAQDGEVSMSQIAQASGLGRGTVHRHFSTREALMEAVRRQARDAAESDEEDSLRPAGELANVMSSPLSVADVLNKVPPFQLGEQIVAEAQRLPGISSAAIYVVDLDGASMQRLAGSPVFPEKIMVPLAVGPEIPREGVAAIRDRFEDRFPGVIVAPLQLRGRAIGVLLAVGTATDELRDLAGEAAIALSLAPQYTDHVDTMRRTRPTSPAAEIQQNMLPPRIARIGGATLAGDLIPSYEIGGDWFDYAENPQGTWIGIADADGSGPGAAGIGAVTLGAFRATRRKSTSPADSIQAMHQVLLELPHTRATSSATIGLWNAPASSFHWVTAGPQPVIRIAQTGELELLAQAPLPRLGAADFPDAVTVNEARIRVGERLLLLSDGVTGDLEQTRAVLTDIGRAMSEASGISAPATVRAIEDLVRATHPDQLSDDAALIVLAPSGMVSSRRS